LAKSTTTTQVITLRVPRTLTDEVRQLATRDSESQATTLRRLLHQALKSERTQRHGDEAA
jgi:hypothetical protein